MFRCTLMADASFCNYWTVLIVKIKCIQTKKNWLSQSNGLFPVYNFFISEGREDREGEPPCQNVTLWSKWVNYLESSPSLQHKLLSLSIWWQSFTGCDHDGENTQVNCCVHHFVSGRCSSSSCMVKRCGDNKIMGRFTSGPCHTFWSPDSCLSSDILAEFFLGT